MQLAFSFAPACPDSQWIILFQINIKRSLFLRHTLASSIGAANPEGKDRKQWRQRQVLQAAHGSPLFIYFSEVWVCSEVGFCLHSCKAQCWHGGGGFPTLTSVPPHCTILPKSTPFVRSEFSGNSWAATAMCELCESVHTTPSPSEITNTNIIQVIMICEGWRFFVLNATLAC